MRMLFLGDIFGRPGRAVVAQRLAGLRRDLGLTRILANAENASGGIGLTAKSARQLLETGLDVLTGGNHTFRHPDLSPLLETSDRLLRPANYPAGAPGRGWQVFRPRDAAPYAVINLLGRTFMAAVDCPFAAAEGILGQLPADVPLRLIDFHAEATSEKLALGWHLDGRVAAVLGTHTHVATLDARVLPGGTAYVTDLGMTGPHDGVIGMTKASSLSRFLKAKGDRWEVASGDLQLHAMLVVTEGRRAVSITRIQRGLP